MMRASWRLAVAAIAGVAVGGMYVAPAGADPVDVYGTAAQLAGEADDAVVDLASIASDVVADAAAACEKTLDVHPDGQPALSFTAYTPGGSSSTWYAEVSATRVTVNSRCRAGVKAVTCIIDKSVPVFYSVYPGRGEDPCVSTETKTGRMTTATRTIGVPYLGADAGGIRPYGRIVVRHKGYNLGSNGKWGLPFVCRDDIFIAQPNGNLLQAVDSEEYRGQECPSTLEQTLLEPLAL